MEDLGAEHVAPLGEPVADDAAAGAPAELTAAEVAAAETDLPADGLRQVIENMEERLAHELTDLRQRFDDRLVYDRFKEEQISRLHEELQGYKQDLLARTSRPLLMAVIRLHADLGRTVAALGARPPEVVTAMDLCRAIDDVRDDLELLLGQHGVERFEVPGDLLDPAQQTVVRTVTTADPALVARIAERVRPGFVQGPTLLQREKVAVYADGMSPNSDDQAMKLPVDPEQGGTLE